MFSVHTLPFELHLDRVQLSAEGTDEKVQYTRVLDGEVVEKQLLGASELMIQPVEPVHLPLVQPALQIQFAAPVHIRAGATFVVYTTFPLEIGVYAGQRDSDSIIDVFTLAKQKLTLYGNSSTGMICRFWESECSQEPLPTTPWVTGLLRLTIHNSTDQWVEISRVMLRAMGMKIFYQDDHVSMSARMRVTGSKTAETGGEDRAIKTGMTRAREAFPSHIFNPTGKQFLMDGGF